MRIIFIIFGLACGLVEATPTLFHVGKPSGRQIIYDRFDASCPGHDVPIIFELQGIRVEGDTLWMNSTFTVKEDIIGDAKMTLNINKCKSKENLDTCEPFHRFNSNKYCAMLESSTSLWGAFFTTFTPRLKCPLKKGVYRATNGEIDLSALMLLQSGNSFWRVNGEVRGKRNNQLLQCYVIDFSIISVSN